MVTGLKIFTFPPLAIYRYFFLAVDLFLAALTFIAVRGLSSCSGLGWSSLWCSASLTLWPLVAAL